MARMNENRQFDIKIDSKENDPILEAIYSICFGPGRFAKAAHILRENNQCLYDISRIVIDNSNGQIIGGCRMWPIGFENGGKGVFLGPIAVLPEYRNFGLGAKLVEAVLSANDEINGENVFLVGDYGFFGKFGFREVPQNIIKLPMPAKANRILWRAKDKDENLNPTFGGKVFALNKQ